MCGGYLKIRADPVTFNFNVKCEHETLFLRPNTVSLLAGFSRRTFSKEMISLLGINNALLKNN